MGNSQSGDGGDCVLRGHRHVAEQWRRIGIRLSIGPYMTGLRGALATMERKLHYFFWVFGPICKIMALTRHRGEGATVPGSYSRGFCCAAYGEADSDPPACLRGLCIPES